MKIKRDSTHRIIIFAVLAVFAIVVVVPYLWMISNSFKTTKEILSDPGNLVPADPTLSGYDKVLLQSPFFKWLLNSLFVTTLSTLAVLFTSSLIGYVFSKYSFKSKKALFMLLLATMMVPAQAMMIPMFILISGIGLYNSLWALIVPVVFSVFGIYLCKQFCDEIPSELMESAKIDGARDMRIYFKIVLPQIRPAIGALGIFTFLEIWNDYLSPLIYLNSSEKMTLPLALSYFNQQHLTDLSATMAASALIMIPVAIVFIIFQKQFIKGISMTGLK
jgi:ABC-type glycerol-3-phosphate transport system permease component